MTVLESRNRDTFCGACTFKYEASRSNSVIKLKVHAMFVNMIGVNCHSVLLLTDLDILSATVLSFPETWMADIHMFSWMQKLQITFAYSLDILETDPPYY